jgi:hypothetical protein
MKRFIIAFLLLTSISYSQITPFLSADTVKFPGHHWIQAYDGILFGNGTVMATAAVSVDTSAGYFVTTYDLNTALSPYATTASLREGAYLSDTDKVVVKGDTLTWLATKNDVANAGGGDTTNIHLQILSLQDSLHKAYDSINVLLGDMSVAQDSIDSLRADIGSGGGTPYDSAGVAYHADVSDAMDYSTLMFFPNLWNKLYDLKLERDSVRMDSTVTKHTQIRVVKFGDSVGGRKGMHIIPILQAAYGDLGSQQDGTCANGATFEGAGAGDRIYEISPSGFYYILPNTGTIIFGAHTGNVFHIMYLAEPGAGNFKIQTQFRSEGYVDEVGYENISADSTTQSLQVITITKDTSDIWYVKLVGLDDTVRVIGTYMTTDLNSGVEEVNWSGNGEVLDNWMKCDSSILRIYLQTIKPDLIFMEWKDPLSGWKSALDSCFARFTRALPTVEFVCLGTPQYEVGDTITVQSNKILRTESKVYSQFFWDSYPLAGNFAKLTALGWQGDGAHLDERADTYYASLLMHDMKIFDNIYEVTSKEIKVDYVTALKGIDIGSTQTSDLSWLRPNGLGLDIITGRDFTFKDFSETKYFGHDQYSLFTGGATGALRIGLATPNPYLTTGSNNTIMVSTDAGQNNWANVSANQFQTAGTNNGLYWYWPDGYGFYRTNITDTLTIDFGSIGAGVDTIRTITSIPWAIHEKPIIVGMNTDLESGLTLRVVCITDGQIIIHLYNNTLTPIDPANRRYTFTAVNK